MSRCNRFNILDLTDYLEMHHLILSLIIIYFWLTMALSDCDGGGSTEGPVACSKPLGASPAPVKSGTSLFSCIVTAHCIICYCGQGHLNFSRPSFSLRGRPAAKPTGNREAQLLSGPLEAMIRPRQQFSAQTTRHRASPRHQREHAPAQVFTRVSGVALGFRG